ncbi:hypothetical protein FF011L_49000 [Roseimaritima multifibrata]|uniref:Uncharacterized protein n=1 Tax=Roseimaritima multifibrata TaxID=1930274 RepID=A0A517MMI6_9BACT|nr:hypothetical protein FF011L_49000 [Roseimaritima multifibrata]
MKRQPKIIWLPLRLIVAFTTKLLTSVTHISLPKEASIGGGLLIPHLGPIQVNPDAKIGFDCAIHHVVTIGDRKPGNWGPCHDRLSRLHPRGNPDRKQRKDRCRRCCD